MNYEKVKIVTIVLKTTTKLNIIFIPKQTVNKPFNVLKKFFKNNILILIINMIISKS